MNTPKLTPRKPLPAVFSFDTWKPILWNLGLIVVGATIFVVGLHSILLPQHFVSGGVTGLAMIAHYWVEWLDVGVVYFVFNLPLLLLGWLSISRRFMLYTVFGMSFFSLMANVVRTPVVQIDDPILAAISAAVVCGIGSGLILRSVGSAGGFDILGVYLSQKFGVRPGAIIFALNLVPLGLGALLYSLEIGLYSVIYSFTYSKVVDAVLTGLNQRKSVLIISKHSREIAHHILTDIKRGVTFLKGEGAYTGDARDVILTITTLTELPKLKVAIFDIDPNAFVVVNDTLEVLGQRHGQLKVY